MKLLLQLENRGERFDVEVEADPRHTVGELAELARQFFQIDAPVSLALSSVGHSHPLASTDRISDTGLTSGAHLTVGVTSRLGSAAVRSPRSRSRPMSTVADHASNELHLAVSSGPDAAKKIRLTHGSHIVGRESTASLVLSDPQVSRQDFTIEIDEVGECTIHPGGERTNELRINGAPVEERIDVKAGDQIRIGSTTLVVRSSAAGPLMRVDAFGTVPFHRTPHRFQPVPAPEFAALGSIPTKPAAKKFQILSIAAPLVMGIVMALMFRRPQFLVFVALSPIVAVLNHFDAKRTGGAEYEQKLVDLDARLAERDAELEQAVAEERRVRSKNSPDSLELLDIARGHSKELWGRGRDSTDFLHLAVGSGELAPSFVTKNETSGDAELRHKVQAVHDRHSSIWDIPVTLNLAEVGVLALVGDEAEQISAANSLALQVCTQHSPEDVIIASAVPHSCGLNEWLKWLPHTRANNSPMATNHLTGDPANALQLLQEVGRVVDDRSSVRNSKFDRRWPWIVLFLERTLDVDSGLTSRILERAAETGVTVIWLTDTDVRVPRQAKATMRLQSPSSGRQSLLNQVDPELPDWKFEPTRISSEVAAHAAQALAPLRDASAVNAASAVPSLVTLNESLGVDQVTPQWVAERWELNRQSYTLKTHIGVSDSGAVVIDLVKDGPHGLIGGTSGAGKSELVQSLVANLLALNAPDRLNLLFIDYKGGALSGLFEHAPHFVGAVTNLDALLSLRALTSLTAELDRRMSLFAEQDEPVKDLKEMIEKYPNHAPPSLVIVVDEFASLVRELPEFVDGIVSIAERGRSLGIHLLLSTQRPSGSINENIQQNTNLRLSLRMLDSSESSNVIGVPDAAFIPGHLKGRGYARLGPGQLVAFQSAWSGAPMLGDEGPPPMRLRPFTTLPVDDLPNSRRSDLTLQGSGSLAAKPHTQLSALLTAVGGAAAKQNLVASERPWLETLPHLAPMREVLALPASIADDVAGVRVTIGMRDDPAQQSQYPCTVDLSDAGGIVVYGNGGSGKTTVLKAVAASAAIRDHQNPGSGLTIVAFDFGSQQLGPVSRLPQCQAVVSGDDLEAVTRSITMLERVFDQRQQMTSTASAAGAALPVHSPILLLLDGYDNLTEAFTASGSASRLQVWLERLQRLIGRGREVAIYPIVSTNSAAGPSFRLMNQLGHRVILRQTEETTYRALGVPGAIANDVNLVPGQALDRDGLMIQIAAVCVDGVAGLQFDPNAVGELGMSLKGAVSSDCITRPLGSAYAPSPVTGDGWPVSLAVADLTLDNAVVDFAMHDFVVVGPPRSGRSTTLRTVAQQLVGQGCEVWVVGSRGSTLEAHPLGWANAAFGKVRDVTGLLEELKEAAESFPRQDRFLIFDDIDRFDDTSLNSTLKALLEADVRCVGSGARLQNLGMNPMQKELKTARAALALLADDDGLIQSKAGRYQVRPGLSMLPGRGVLVVDGIPRVVQITTDTVQADLEQ